MNTLETLYHSNSEQLHKLINLVLPNHLWIKYHLWIKQWDVYHIDSVDVQRPNTILFSNSTIRLDMLTPFAHIYFSKEIGLCIKIFSRYTKHRFITFLKDVGGDVETYKEMLTLLTGENQWK